MTPAKAPRRKVARLVWVLTAFVVIFVIWAQNAPLDEVVRGPGTIVPASNAQVVQSLEGGILEEIAVREGDYVTEGQVIARLNATQYRAAVLDFEGQILAIEARLLRLEAELDGAPSFRLPERFWTQDAALAASEERLFTARVFDHTSALAAAEEQLALQTEQVEITRAMVEQNAMPAIELSRMRAAASESRAAVDRLEASFLLERSEEMSTLLTELSRLEAQVEQSRDQLARSTLVSPADGIVNTLYTTTLGGVVQSGEPIFEITPLNDELLVEARIFPRDIAFVVPGMRATIKLSAYDYAVYGSLSGEVTQISADTFEDETGRGDEPYYKVLIAVTPESLADRADVFDIRPGMLADAELHAGQKTVMQYLITPLIRSTEALREP